jgi:biotin transport system substrate-specific component
LVVVRFVSDYRQLRSNVWERLSRMAEGRETLTKALGAVALALVTAVAAQFQLQTPLTPVPFTGQVFAVLLTGALLGARWGMTSQALYLGMGAAGLPVFAGGASGLGVFRGLTVGYLVGFVLAAGFVGWYANRRRLEPTRGLLLGAPVGLLTLCVLAALDVALLTQRASYWGAGYTSRDALLNFILLAGLLAIVGAFVSYVVLENQYRERFEMFLAMIVGLVIIYAVGALGFWTVGTLLAETFPRLQPVTLEKVLELAVAPFLAADLLKAALAVAVVSLLVPRKSERVQRGA